MESEDSRIRLAMIQASCWDWEAGMDGETLFS
jgi:hypothetical protein